MIYPKKPQILYAPMLASMGGGSATGYGRGVGGLGPTEEAIFILKRTHNADTHQFTWTVPDGVTSVAVLAIGGGGGGKHYKAGAGGGLGWRNSHGVTAGQNITVQVGRGGHPHSVPSGISGIGGDDGHHSWFESTSVCKGEGGQGGTTSTYATGGGYSGDGGGTGGGTNSSVVGNVGGAWHGAGGGGAGGYGGNGGNGGSNGGSGTSGNQGGGGGGGATYETVGYGYAFGGGGGGTGILGRGNNGSGGSGGNNGGSASLANCQGLGGSGGGDGSNHFSQNGPAITIGTTNYTGDAGGAFGGGSGNNYGGGGAGVVRVVWASGAAFPTTNVGQYYNPTIYVSP